MPPTFQTVPTELRLKVYEHMTPPIDSRISDWRGIFLSCKQFNHELQHELLRNMALHLSHRQSHWFKIHGTQLRIQKPRSIADIEHITVAIPNSYFREREALSPGTRRYSSTILALMQLGITELKFERYEDDEEGMKRTTVPVTEHAVADFLRDMIDLMRPCNPWTVKLDDGTNYVLGQGCAIDTIAFDWGKFTGTFADEDLVLPYYAGDAPLDRNVKLNRELVCGPTTGAVWTRKPYTWYGRVVEEFWGKVASSGSFLVMGS